MRAVYIMLLLMHVYGDAMDNATYTGIPYVAGVYARLKSWLTTLCAQESEQIQRIRSDKNNFLRKLSLPALAREKYSNEIPIAWTYVPETRIVGKYFFEIVLDPAKITADPTLFVRYCYYQQYHEESNLNLAYLASHSTLLPLCQETTLDGYSAIGAAILAKDTVLIGYRRRFLEQLMQYGFRCTKKDRQLIALEIYDTMSIAKQAAMIRLSLQGQGYFVLLPYEIRMLILQRMLYPVIHDMHLPDLLFDQVLTI
jgi:hypothetical protein